MGRGRIPAGIVVVGRKQREGRGMKEELPRRGGTLRTIVAFSLGATIGSIAALLYAPASGEVTRRRLALKVRNMQRSAARQLGQTQRAFAKRAGQVREAASEWIAEHMPQGNGRHPLRRRVDRRLVSH